MSKVTRKCFQLKPDLYKSIFIDLIQAQKDKNLLQKVLLQIEDYMDVIIKPIYAPVIRYIRKRSYPVSESELRDYLSKKGAGTHTTF